VHCAPVYYKVGEGARISTQRRSGVVNLNRIKSRKPLFHVVFFRLKARKIALRELGFKTKTPKVGQPVISDGLQSQPVRSAHPTNWCDVTLNFFWFSFHNL